MAYTFGGAVSDTVNIDVPIGFASNNAIALVTGWWNPTGLGSGGRLWSFGVSTGLETDSVAGELRVRIDRATTDGQWTTSTAGLTAGNWYFIATCVSTTNTSSAEAVKIWLGTVENPPAAVTASVATTASGNCSANTTFVIGNNSSAVVAFGGDIEHVTVSQSNGTADLTNPFNIAAYGAITATEEQFILERFVYPAWLGDYGAVMMKPSSNGNYTAYHNNLDNDAKWVGVSYTSALWDRTEAKSGATWSQGSGPRPHHGMVMAHAVNRRRY